MPLFVSGYLAVLDVTKSTHHPLMMKLLKELMSDTEVYGWEAIRS